jgi:preprotein translocase subunit SecD
MRLACTLVAFSVAAPLAAAAPHGLRLVYDARLDDAVAREIDRMAADLEARLRPHGARVEVADRALTVRFAVAGEARVIDASLLKRFAGALVEVGRDGGAVRLRVDDAYVEAVRAQVRRLELDAVRARLAQRSITPSTLTLDGTTLTVVLPPLAPDDSSRAEALIARSARLELKLVDHAAPYGERLAARAQGATGVTVEHERWTRPGDLAERSATYLRARDRGALDRLLATLPVADRPPPDHQIVLEHVGGEWRTHYVWRRAELSGADIGDANVVFDRDTRQPSILVRLGAGGAARLAELTAAHIGDKLAIVLDDVVSMAPVIATRVAGGELRIALANGDPLELADEARDLVALLRVGALPASLVLRSKSIE